MRRVLAVVLFALAVTFHVTMLGKAWEIAHSEGWVADFATFYYAGRYAREGGNPYDTPLLSGRAALDGTVVGVHPYFYPPPFLLTTLWSGALEYRAAYLAWFWIGEALAILCALILAWWWRDTHPSAAWVAALATATLTAVPDNLIMGQMNLPVMALVLGGLALTEGGRERSGGALVGLACMMKMSPALFVAWWMLRGRWRAVAWAVGSAVALSVLALPLAGPEVQRDFAVRVLPGFGSGDYNGLVIPIGLFGNHSLVDLLHRLWPGGRNALSPTARRAALLVSLGLLGLLAAWFRRAPGTPWSIAGQIAAIALVMLLIPVYTYEHHLVWALPAVVVTHAALLARRLRVAWAVLLLPAWLVWAWPLASVQRLAVDFAASPWTVHALREAKTLALLALLAACLAVVPRRG